MSTIIDGFINVDVTVADFKIETAFGVCANPGFILNGGALATKIRKWNQITGFTFLAFGEIIGRFQ
jgi:hypothetical protein